MLVTVLHLALVAQIIVRADRAVPPLPAHDVRPALITCVDDDRDRGVEAVVQHHHGTVHGAPQLHLTRNPQRHLIELVVVRQTHRQKHLATLEHVRHDRAVVVLSLYRLVRDEGDGLRRTARRAPDAGPTHVVRHLDVLARRRLQLQRHRLHQEVVLVRQKTPTLLTLVLEFHHKKAVSVHLLDETPASAAR